MKVPSFFFWGTQACTSASQRRHVQLSNIIAIGLFGVSITLEIAYLNVYGLTFTAWSIFIISILILLTLIINRLRLIVFSRIWLSLFPTVALLVSSVIIKTINPSGVWEYDYFTYRFVLLSLAALPVVLFSNKEVKVLMLCLVTSGLLLFLFDSIHTFFGVGNRAALLPGSKYFFANIVIAVAYVIIIGSVFFLKSDSERSETITEKVIDETESTKQTLIRYQNAILSLAKVFRTTTGSEAELSKRLCEALAINLNVNRVSVWTLKEGNENLTRTHLHEADGSTDETVTLHRSDFPSYFQALESQPFIMAAEAQTNPNTKEFTETYLKPLRIYSMLDCPIMFENMVVGVVCCENQNAIRQWKPEDVLFVQSMADLISVYKQNEEIKRLYITVNQQNRELVGKSEEIRSINSNLEILVQKRTRQLEDRNKKLTDYGFINSHLLRAPLTRIMGLSDLISLEVNPQDKNLLIYLLDSCKELDKVVNQINDTLNENQILTKEGVISGIAEHRNLNKTA